MKEIKPVYKIASENTSFLKNRFDLAFNKIKVFLIYTEPLNFIKILPKQGL